MGIESRHFNALVEDLGRSLNKFKVPPREQKELVAILAPMKKDIVTR
jgi:hemoglobin